MGNARKKILVVDDNTDFVQFFEDVLGGEYDILKAYDGESGFDLAVKEQPDLMLLDVMMAHDTEGFEVSRKISETPELKNMKILMITSITSEKNLPFKFEPDDTWLPVDEVLEKPVAPDVLIKKVKERLGE